MDRFKAFLMTVIPFGICIIVIFYHCLPMVLDNFFDANRTYPLMRTINHQ